MGGRYRRRSLKREHDRHHKLPMREPYATRYEGHKIVCRHYKGRMFYPCSYMVFHDYEWRSLPFCGIDGRECDGEKVGDEG